MPADETSPLGPLLFNARVELRLTQEALVEAVARRGSYLGQTTLSSYERGKSEPPWSMAVLLAEILGLDLNDMAAPFRQLERAS